MESSILGSSKKSDTQSMVKQKNKIKQKNPETHRSRKSRKLDFANFAQILVVNPIVQVKFPKVLPMPLKASY